MTISRRTCSATASWCQPPRAVCHSRAICCQTKLTFCGFGNSMALSPHICPNLFQFVPVVTTITGIVLIITELKVLLSSLEDGCSYPSLHADHTLRAPWSLHRAGGWGGDGGARGGWRTRHIGGRGVGKQWWGQWGWGYGGDFGVLILLDSLTGSWWRSKKDVWTPHTSHPPSFKELDIYLQDTEDNFIHKDN